MIKNLLLLLLCVCVFGTIDAQRNCGSMEILEEQLQKDPKMQSKMNAIEKATQQFKNDPSKAVNGVITIPVVVHVVYNGSTQNISEAQILSQIQILNEDFRRTNSDADGTWSQAADAEIEFCMATVDPNGNATNGITRTSTNKNGFGTNDSVKFGSQGGKDAWPANNYLNIWVCNIGGGILGYAQFPGGDPATDGVVNDYRYFGNTGTATAPFDLGRTMTHEVGHYLNLRHIWGDGGCSVDDFVTDTPTSDASNGGCSVGHESCGSVDMVQNYMDYSDDACMNLFTQGQKTRMRALFEPGGARVSLLSSPACGNPAEPTCSDGIQNGNETGVDCGGPDCAPCNTNCTTVSISITFDNYPEETSWSITNASGGTVASGGTYGSQADGSTLNLTECLVDGCYDFTINDSYGDGICCSYGNGSYSVTVDGSVVASGGSFTSSETTNFCVGGNAPTCNDGVQNGDETGVDCGGSNCAPCATCSDGVQNGNETGVDCGGPDCAPCATCNDGVQNGNETGVDCGGPDCAPCATCNDGVQNGNETGVDCGGPDCAPCNTGCTDVNITITFDNYPEETSWSITDAGGSTVASGGTYGSQADGSTLNLTECLSDGCYDFTINDAYGDGICCSYGNGSYSVSVNGSVVASGGSFASSETTNFCIGGTAPTCNDGVQNGNETGVDCGGPDCAPCNTGGCSQVAVDFNNLDSGWGNWNDGGSDCIRSSSSANAYSGIYSIRLRDNTSTSTTTSDPYNLAGFEEVTVEFTYIAQSMETGEDFWLQASLDNGEWQTLTTYASGTDFSNGVREFETVVITGDFTSNTRFRFRCDASSNADYVYIDDINISGCANGSREIVDEDNLTEAVTIVSEISDVRLYPNPVSDRLNIELNSPIAQQANVMIMNADGSEIKSTIQKLNAGVTILEESTERMAPGVYYMVITQNEQRIIKRFVVIQ